MRIAADYVGAIKTVSFGLRHGAVLQLQGLAVDVAGLNASIGDLCRIEVQGHRDDAGPRGGDGSSVLAEVVGVRAEYIRLMPYGSLQGISAGCRVLSLGRRSDIGVGRALLGRIIDGFGASLDERPPPAPLAWRSIQAVPVNPLKRPPIKTILETGIRAIDGLLTIGSGQRVGIFAGSGVGKSTLLGMITKNVSADINVIALIGERGREVRDFVENQLGDDGLKRSVVVVATADQPALARIRAAYAAFTIAEYFRDAGLHVLLTMDSITRLAMARREVGLSAGEPPTARGYTPSVFAELPQLCERCGTSNSGGSITALMTVLVDGDDLNEPVSDSLRAILDGHIVLSRSLAHQGHYPAIDVLKSASRLLPSLATREELELTTLAISKISLLERNRQMIEVGGYERGSNPTLDAALAIDVSLKNWLCQAEGGADRRGALTALRSMLATKN